MDIGLQLLQVLQELQKNVIGIAQIHKNIKMVISEDEFSFTTIWIGNLGGVEKCNYPKSKFQFKSFPIKDNMKPYNMFEFLKNPVEYYNWYSKHFI